MARKTQTLELAQTAGMERLVVALVSRLAVLVPPWAVLALLLIVSAVSHALWGKPPAVTWATMAATLSTTLLTGLTWLVAHARGPIGRVHTTLTTLFAGLWFTIATITGVNTPVTGGMLFFGGGTLALGWNIRAVIRATHGGEGAAGGDPLGALFDNAKNSFGLGGAKVRTKEVTDHKIKGKLELPAGEKTSADVIKRTEYIEGGMHLPPGSVLIAQDEDDAAQAHITVTDPRVMKKPLPWPGPSRPGASIAEPLRVGLFQDMEPAEPVLPGNHVQIMGKSGSGKSFGGGWNYLSEIITRRDAVVFAADLAKDKQTLGPLEEALHVLAVTKADVVALIRGLLIEIPQRTKWLSDHGYTDWEEGCGLDYWIVHFEEVAKMFDELSTKDVENVEQIAKEIRSAGGSLIMSLQRSTHTEMPTIVRGQLSNMCFGVGNASDASYGLSEAQQEGEARPQMWGSKPEFQGMAYLDARGIPATHVAMPLRTYFWGQPRMAAAAMRAHAAQYPAAAKQVDEFTARLVSRLTGTRTHHAIPMPAGPDIAQGPGEVDGDQDELLAMAAELVIATQLASPAMLQRKLRIRHEQSLRLLEALERHQVIGPQPTEATGHRPVLVAADDLDEVLDRLREHGDAAADYLRTADPSPELTAGPDDEIREPTLREDTYYVGDKETEAQHKARKLPPDQARARVHDWIRHRARNNRPSFTAGDPELTAVRTNAGMTSRGWIYKVLTDLVAIGVLAEDKDGTTTYTIVDLDPLGDLGQEAA
jgi:Ftsk gamma domain